MKIIVCLDDKGGMLFNHRRQSRDSAQLHHMLALVGGSRLYMNEYSGRLFKSAEKNVTVDDNFLFFAGEGDYCFVENEDVSDFLDVIEEVVIYRWGRVYPSDVRFPVSMFASRWTLTHTEEFPGSSHEKITVSRYSL